MSGQTLCSQRLTWIFRFVLKYLNLVLSSCSPPSSRSGLLVSGDDQVSIPLWSLLRKTEATLRFCQFISGDASQNLSDWICGTLSRCLSLHLCYHAAISIRASVVRAGSHHRGQRVLIEVGNACNVVFYARVLDSFRHIFSGHMSTGTGRSYDNTWSTSLFNASFLSDFRLAGPTVCGSGSCRAEQDIGSPIAHITCLGSVSLSVMAVRGRWL